MAAAPETQFGQAGLTVPQFAAHVYTPGYVNVPTQAGELWAQVGQNALAAGKQVLETLMNSPLNPAVKAKMRETIAGSQLAMDQIADIRAHPQVRRAITGVETPEVKAAAPATLQYQQTTGYNLDQPWEKTDTTKKAATSQQTSTQPVLTSTGPNTAIDQKTGEPYFRDSTGKMVKGLPPATNLSGAPTPPTSFSAGMATPGTSYQQGGLVQPQSNLYAPARTVQPPAAPSGLMPQIAAGAASPQQRLPPPVQPIPGQPTVPIAGQPTVPTPSASMHPVMSSETALQLAKKFDTSTNRAVYLPNTPQGPGFQFYGPKNTPLGPPVPITTLVRHGGAGLVAGENFGTVLGAADQNTAMQSGVQGYQQGGSVTQDQPPGQQSPTIASDQGPPPAPTYNPAPYQQAVAQANANPANLTASNEPAGQPSKSPERPLPGTPVQLTTSAEDKAALDSDANSATPQREWIPVKNDKGQVTGRYTEMDSERAGFYKRRYYAGTPGWLEGIWDPDLQKKQFVLDEFSGPTGPPTDRVLDYDEIKNMNPKELDGWIQYDRSWRNHPTAVDATSDEQKQLRNGAFSIKDAQMIEDQLLWAQQNHLNPKDWNIEEIRRAEEAAERDGLWGPDHLAHDFLARWGPDNPFARAMGQNISNLNEHLARTAGGKYPYAATPQQSYFEAGIPWTSLQFRMRLPTNVSNISEINRIATGGPYDESLATIRNLKNGLIDEYRKNIKTINDAGRRPPPEDIDNNIQLGANGYLRDNYNRMRDKDNNLINNYGPPPEVNAFGDWQYPKVNLGPQPLQAGDVWSQPVSTQTARAAASPAPSPTPKPAAAPSATPSPTPRTIRSQEDLDAFMKTHPKSGTVVYDKNGKPWTVP